MSCLLQPVLVVAGQPFVVATAAVAAVARGAPYLFSGWHVVGLGTSISNVEVPPPEIRKVAHIPPSAV